MVGIDIVDHTDPLLRNRDERAFRLIRHPNDTHKTTLIQQEQLFWLYWAAKESVYKARRRHERFDPKNIAITITESNGSFHFESEQFQGLITQDPKTTLSVCGSIPIEKLIYAQFDSKASDHSAEIRRLMINHFKETYKMEIEIGRDLTGLPISRFGDRNHLTTFTHHHHQMAFVCEA